MSHSERLRALVFLVIVCAGCGNGTKTLKLSIVTPSLPDDMIGSPYNGVVQVTGGTAPFA
jgi:hypothetical protein